MLLVAEVIRKKAVALIWIRIKEMTLKPSSISSSVSSPTWQRVVVRVRKAVGREKEWRRRERECRVEQGGRGGGGLIKVRGSKSRGSRGWRTGSDS